ncbi:nitrilase-related carbon-nitrogen hydrolase [Desulfoluna spongiiphila]|uniref:N-carbamoylputrescine amidase n=1 Tax=Desulfoluna spongiiphila TaxID=419481 RepID=A0A1G5AM85_9BACT|nr:nitrilase-related carbon-nitrogen hydrolase [Desulfoluna spongiiphila]SCX78997.1 N-carbamoylputrescine amidase [Desulfoluna spongiiphila]
MESLRLALASVSASLADPHANVQTMHQACRKAREARADLVVLPELSLTGYANASGAANRALTEEQALDLIEGAVDAFGIGILAGYAEKNAAGEMYASHTALLPDGGHTTYRKLHLAPPEKGLYRPGTDLPLFAFKGFTIGMMLCYDAHFPLAFHRMAQDSADLIIVPHASPRGTSEEKYDSWMRHLPARAFDNGLWVAAVNQCGTNEANLSFPPLALALDPSGHLTGPPRLTEGLHLVTISQKKLTDVRSHPMRYFLPNTRNDL